MTLVTFMTLVTLMTFSMAFAQDCIPFPRYGSFDGYHGTAYYPMPYPYRGYARYRTDVYESIPGSYYIPDPSPHRYWHRNLDGSYISPQGGYIRHMGNGDYMEVP